MKKYIISLWLLLVAQNIYTMESISDQFKVRSAMQLSREDKAKALSFAKLFNKYPKGYGKDDDEKKKIKEKMDLFSQDEKYKALYWNVKEYQNILKNIEASEEAEEIFYSMYDILKPDIKQRIFIDVVYDDANQYYAMSNALEFSKIIEDYDNIKFYKKCFLFEVNEGNIPYLSVHHTAQKNFSGLISCDILENNQKKYGTYLSEQSINQLDYFLCEGTKKDRVKKFQSLLSHYIEDISKIDDVNKGKNKFIELFMQLKGHSNKQHMEGIKGPGWDNYILLPLEDILKESANCDVMFYLELSNSNDLNAHRVEFDQEKLEKWQQFPENRRKKLQDFYIKLKSTPLTVMEHMLMHGSLLFSSLTPDLIAYSTGPIAAAIGCGATTMTILSVIASLALNEQIGSRFFPYLYAKFNSHTPLVKTCIQQEKMKKIRPQGFWLLMSNGLHMICSFLGNKCLPFVSLPVKVVGAITHGIRIPLYYYTHQFMCWDDSRNDFYKARDLKVQEVQEKI